MTSFLIAYDLARPQANKHALASAIMMIGQSWARPLENTWYVKADMEASDIEAILSGLLGDDDGLLVQPVAESAQLTNTALRWFKRRSTAPEASNVVAFPVIPELPAVEEYPLAQAV